MEIFRRLGFADGFRKVRSGSSTSPVGKRKHLKVTSIQIGVADNYSFDVVFSTGFGSDDKEVNVSSRADCPHDIPLNASSNLVRTMVSAVPRRLCHRIVNHQ
jgi:hypothetical protein